MNPVTDPIRVDSVSIVTNEWVSMRATVGGMTRTAAIRVTPSTWMPARMVAASATIIATSIQPVATPEAAATSGSNVVNSNGR